MVQNVGKLKGPLKEGFSKLYTEDFTFSETFAIVNIKCSNSLVTYT